MRIRSVCPYNDVISKAKHSKKGIFISSGCVACLKHCMNLSNKKCYRSRLKLLTSLPPLIPCKNAVACPCLALYKVEQASPRCRPVNNGPCSYCAFSLLLPFLFCILFSVIRLHLQG